jgi:hypothetical protein
MMMMMMVISYSYSCSYSSSPEQVRMENDLGLKCEGLVNVEGYEARCRRMQHHGLGNPGEKKREDYCTHLLR